MGAIEQQKVYDWIIKRLKSPNKSFKIAGHTFDIDIGGIVWTISSDSRYQGVFIVESPDDLKYVARWVCTRLTVGSIVCVVDSESIGKL